MYYSREEIKTFQTLMQNLNNEGHTLAAVDQINDLFYPQTSDPYQEMTVCAEKNRRSFSLIKTIVNALFKKPQEALPCTKTFDWMTNQAGCCNSAV